MLRVFRSEGDSCGVRSWARGQTDLEDRQSEISIQQDEKESRRPKLILAGRCHVWGIQSPNQEIGQLS